MLVGAFTVVVVMVVSLLMSVLVFVCALVVVLIGVLGVGGVFEEAVSGDDVLLVMVGQSVDGEFVVAAAVDNSDIGIFERGNIVRAGFVGVWVG